MTPTIEQLTVVETPDGWFAVYDEQAPVGNQAQADLNATPMEALAVFTQTVRCPFNGPLPAPTVFVAEVPESVLPEEPAAAQPLQTSMAQPARAYRRRRFLHDSSRAGVEGFYLRALGGYNGAADEPDLRDLPVQVNAPEFSIAGTKRKRYFEDDGAPSEPSGSGKRHKRIGTPDFVSRLFARFRR